jgi:hypothetical protein
MSFATGTTLKDQNNADSNNYLNSKNTALVKPKASNGIMGYVFDIPTTENVNIEFDITDNYVESGTYLNDHVVKKPERITLSGLIGENVVINEGVDGQLEEITNKLELVDAYLGDYTPGMVQSIQFATSQAAFAVSAVNQFANKIKNVVDLLDGEEDEETRQQKLYKQVKSLAEMKTVLTCQTPWEYFDSVMIESISVAQNEDTNQITNMTVTLKVVRFAELEFTNFNENLFPPREAVQKEDTKETGTVKGQDENASILYNLFAEGN